MVLPIDTWISSRKEERFDWIVGFGGSDNNAVDFDLVRGTQEEVKKYLVSAARAIRMNDPDDYDYGTESVEEVEERAYSVYAFVCFCDYHIDIEATPLELLTLRHLNHPKC